MSKKTGRYRASERERFRAIFADDFMIPGAMIPQNVRQDASQPSTFERFIRSLY